MGNDGNVSDLLRKAEEAYHNGHNPIMSDAEYDAIKRKVGTNVVGAPVKDAATIQHDEPMLSLSNIFSEDEADEFLTKYREHGVVLECKLDGIAINLTYENHRLVSVATRGDGHIGEDITDRSIHVGTIPQRLDPKGPLPSTRFSIYGEAVMRKSTLKYMRDNGSTLANTRNSVAGAMRSKSTDQIISRRIRFIPHGYSFSLAEALGLDSHSAIMQVLSNSFDVSPLGTTLLTEVPETESCIEMLSTDLDLLDYDIDGIVMKIDSLSKRRELGNTRTSPRWSTAYKFPATAAVTTCIGVEYGIGRTGAITPVALLEPVQLAGVTISRCTLHNFDEVERLGIQIGSTVTLVRSGEVIPYITQVLSSGHTPITMPVKCGVCDTPTSEDSCVNQKCHGVLSARATHAYSRALLDIDGVGDVASYNIAKLYPDSPLALYENDFPWSSLEELIGSAVTAKIRANVYNRRSIPMATIIQVICPVGIGAATANAVAMSTKDLNKLMSYSESIPTNISGFIGPHKSRLLQQGIVENMSFIKRILDKVGIDLDIISSTVDDVVGTVAITGKFSVSRKAMTEYIERNGYRVVSSVTANTSYLIVEGDSSSSKYKAAEKLGIPKVDFNQFKEIIKNAT